MAATYNLQRSSYVCVDQNAVASPDTDKTVNTVTALMSPVELNSQPASTFSELTCAVCSQPRADVKCPNITAPDLGAVSCTNGKLYGSQCTYSCPGNRVLKGPTSVSCGLDSKWSANTTAIECVAPKSTAAAVYTRWGNDRCEPFSTLLYSGRMAGTRASAGSGANRLCLPPTADTKGVSAGREGGATIWPVEYKTAAYASRSLINTSQNSNKKNVCSV